VDIIMKKTLLALSVLVASTAANASIEVYNKDGASVNLYGLVEVELVKSTTKDTDPVLQVEDADFGVTMAQVVNDDITAIAETSYDAAGGTAEQKNTFVGLDTTAGKFTFGKQDTVYDGAGVGNDKEFGIASKIDDIGLNSKNLAMYSYDSDVFFAAVSTIIDGDDSTDFVDGKVGARFGDFEARVFFLDGESATIESDLVSVQAQYAANNIDVEVSYATGEVNDADVDIISLAAGYSMGDYGFNAGWSNKDVEGAADDVNAYFVNVTYALAVGTTAYAEIGGNDVDNTDTGYVVGMEVKF
jgi:predicted porin